jgi:hypothetical protein
LIKGYAQKNENYRRRTTVVDERGIVHGTFRDLMSSDPANRPAYKTLKYVFEAAYPLGSITHIVGDPFVRNSMNFAGIEASSGLWGVLAGYGLPSSIGSGWLTRSTASMAASRTDPSLEPRIAFYGLLGSYFMDWNMSDDFLRAALGTPNYGVAGLIIRSSITDIDAWGFAAFANNEPLGVALLAGANQYTRMDRIFAIMGDPTLRIRTVSPVANLNGTSFPDRRVLSWTVGEPNCQYYVFRAAGATGPWGTPLAGPLAGTSYTDYTTQSFQYMVRAVKSVASGHGSSYWNVSQGTFWPAIP